ncbi:hypothetical protein B0H17DRAFT_1140585 [Mycena rosella]|uniref:protein-tyrosine-phosphatase n=1 Tax=Mycena rosella TaxID=1033263 RepID=A0AAD7D352_MYCRO|nr:hypothetical protein B0H17DRAFT_1140585 [Mycena rosella]
MFRGSLDHVDKNVHNVSHHQTDDTRSFADAIAARFGQPDPVLTARLLPPVLRLPSTPMAKLSLQPTQRAQQPPQPQQPPSSTKYTAVAPAALSLWLDDPRTLVVDIRPHAAYSSAHISRAIALSVPSTLLKRPLFSLQRLSAMLPSRSARTRFSAWRSAPRILIYDADSATISDTSNIQGLLRKFRAEAPDAPIDLAWVQGGFQAVWSQRRDLVESVPPTPETETEDEETDDDPDAPQRVLRAHHLPRAAFALSSTTQAPARSGPAPVLHHPDSAPSKERDRDTDTHAFNPFFDTVRQNAELAHGITERIPLRLPRRVRRRIPELPFPWLREIARRAAPATPSPPAAAPHTYNFGAGAIRGRADSSEDESSDSSSGSAAWGTPSPALRIEEGTEALAMQFYRIELAEQRRLMGVMEHHSRESGEGNANANAPANNNSNAMSTDASGSESNSNSGSNSGSGSNSTSGSGSSGRRRRAAFPFSITAGVEKGSKNRYRNIWPFEHARVRLHARARQSHAQRAQSHSEGEAMELEMEGRDGEAGEAEQHDDYVNASYVQPLGTQRRYIATQGPLEATFGDFWTLVWQQNTHVIVMLTREVEGAMVKCGAYWRSGTYGPLRVELLGCDAGGCEGSCAACAGEGEGGFFGALGGGGGDNNNNTNSNSNSNSQHNTSHNASHNTSHPTSHPTSHTSSHPTSPPPPGAGQLIKRTLRLTHAGYPRAAPRRVVQLQYLGWPDMNVPEDARGVLGVVWEVARVVEAVGRAEAVNGAAMEDDAGADAYSEATDADADAGGSGSESEVDGATGVLRRALRGGAARAAVVLHCSAGVGRTGGFIAVDAVLDAVRREAREAYTSAGAGAPQRTFAPRAGSGEEAIPGLSAGMRASGIGAAGGAGTMDVDGEEGGEGRGMRTPMQVDSVEGGDMGETRRWAERVAYTRTTVTDPKGAFTFGAAKAVPGATSGFYSLPTASFPSTGSFPPTATSSLPPTVASFPSTAASSLPPTLASSASYPSTAASTPFQFQAPARAGFLLTLPGGLPAPRTQNGETKSASLPIKPGAGVLPLAVRRGYADHRLRTFSAPNAAPNATPASAPMPWLLPNSPVPATILGDRPLAKSPLPDRPRSLSPFSAPSQHRSMHSLDGQQQQQQQQQQPAAGVGAGTGTRHVDYMEPRALYGRGVGGPVRLSSFEDPIWEVLQDMREQRMSLCQSLRQYVFVHAAIIEGALMVVDEERARAGAAWRVPRPPRPTLFLVPSDESTTSSTGKRLASPTELPKEDTKGEIVLSKRPSIKRKQASGYEYAPPLSTYPPP